MARSAATLAVSVIAKTGKFLRGFKQMRRELRHFQKLMRTTARTIRNVGIAIAGMATVTVVTLGKAAKAGEAFSQQMARSLAIMGHVDLGLRKQMVNTALEVAAATKNSSAEAAQAYFYLASAGLSAEQALKALPAVAQFAQAGMFDMSTATSLAADAQSALGMKVGDATKNLRNLTRVTDVLVKANTLANATVEQFSQSLTTKAGAAFKIVNKDIEEAVAVLAAFANQGIKGEEAGTALNIVMRDLTTKAITNAEAFKAAKVQVYDASGKMQDMASILADLEDALAGASDETKKLTLKQLGFQDRSVVFIQSLIGQSRQIAIYEAALRRAGGTTERVAEKQLTPMERALANMESAWTNIGLAIRPTLTILAEAIDKMASLMDSTAAIFSPEVVTLVLETVLNRVDIFIRELGLKIQKIGVAMLGLPAMMAQVMDPLGWFPKLREPFRQANAEYQAQKKALEDMQTALQGGESVPGLLGTKLVQPVKDAMDKLAKTLADDKLRSAQEKWAETMDALRSAWGRFMKHPGETIASLLLGVPYKRPKAPEESPMKAAMETVPYIFRASNLSPYIHAQPGVNLGRQEIRVQYMRDLLEETKKQTKAIDDLDMEAVLG